MLQGPPELESLRQGTSRAAELRAKLSRRGLRCPLERIVVQHLAVARVAEGLGVAWNTANDAVLAEGKRVLIDDPSRFDGVQVIGVDERVFPPRSGRCPSAVSGAELLGQMRRTVAIETGQQ